MEYWTISFITKDRKHPGLEPGVRQPGPQIVGTSWCCCALHLVYSGLASFASVYAYGRKETQKALSLCGRVNQQALVGPNDKLFEKKQTV